MPRISILPQISALQKYVPSSEYIRMLYELDRSINGVLAEYDNIYSNAIIAQIIASTNAGVGVLYTGTGTSDYVPKYNSANSVIKSTFQIDSLDRMVAPSGGKFMSDGITTRTGTRIYALSGTTLSLFDQSLTNVFYGGGTYYGFYFNSNSGMFLDVDLGTRFHCYPMSSGGSGRAWYAALHDDTLLVDCRTEVGTAPDDFKGLKFYNGADIHGLPTPVDADEASTKDYTDSLKQTNRTFAPASPLTMNISNLYPFVADKAAFVYIGYFPKSVTVKYVSIHNQTGGSGAQTAEVGLFSTPLAPNKGGQTLTCLAATGSLGDLTTTGMLRNSSSLNYAVPAGTHLWAGMRTDMATTQPECRSVGGDWGSGTTLYTDSATVFSATNTYTGLIPTAAYFDADAPDLRVELD